MHLQYGEVLLLVRLAGFELSFGVRFDYLVSSVLKFSVFHFVIKLIRVAEVRLKLQLFYTLLLNSSTY
jgi:hypothetical protein